MTNIAFIPVRGGSKSIPLKNIKPLNGKPLVYWTAKAANDAACVDKVIIATDCDAIRDAVRGFDLPKVELYDRDSENAQDGSSTESVMLEYLEKADLKDDDAFFLIQATSPLLKHEHIELMYKKMLFEKADSALSCVRNKRFYWSEDGKSLNYDYRARPRRQDFDGLMMENGACYINTVGNIKRDKNRLSGKISVYEMPEYTATEIDEPDDFLIIEKLMKKYGVEKTPKPDIKLFLTDCDGVLTDGGMYYAADGIESKKFNTKDGMAFELLRKAGIKTGIITSEKTEIVRNRAVKIKADELFLGVKDKLNVVKGLCDKYGITLKDVAYIGDDINDISVLSVVGIAACPADAQNEIKQIANIHILTKSGGQGVVREFMELMV